MPVPVPPVPPGTTPPELLILDTLPLLGNTDTDFTLEAFSGSDFGDPQPITQVMQTFLQDGAIVATSRHDNRTLVLNVRIKSASLTGLALGEAALVAVCRQTWGSGAAIIELQWQPPDLLAPVCVFDVVAAQLDFAFDDFAETQPNLLGRTYKLTLTALPFARSNTTTTATIPAPTSTSPVTPTVTVLDPCTSLTNWSMVASGGTMSIVSDGIIATWSPTPAGQRGLKRSSLGAAMGTDPYVLVKATSVARLTGRPPAGEIPHFFLNGVQVVPVAQSGDQYWLPFTGTLNTVAIQGGYVLGSGYVTGSVWCGGISRTNMIAPGTLTQHEVSRQFPISGSVRAPATISVRGVDPTTGNDAALGQTVVYTTSATDSASPPLRAVRVDGGSSTTDTTAYSGAHSPLSTTHLFDQPITALPSAGYALVARVQCAATGSKGYQATAVTKQGATNVSDTQTVNGTVNIATANTWQLVHLATIAGPPGQAGSAAVVEIGLSSTDGLILDEAWLFDLDHGQLTMVDAAAQTHLWLDAATAGDPTPGVFIGTLADRSDSYAPTTGLLSWQMHEVRPDMLNVFVASGSPPEVSLSYYPTYHTHVAA